MFVQPKIDIETKVPPKLAELSDKNRRARTIERSADPKNPLPFSRGNSANRVVADATTERPQPTGGIRAPPLLRAALSPLVMRVTMEGSGGAP